MKASFKNPGGVKVNVDLSDALHLRSTFDEPLPLYQVALNRLYALREIFGSWERAAKHIGVSRRYLLFLRKGELYVGPKFMRKLDLAWIRLRTDLGLVISDN